MSKRFSILFNLLAVTSYSISCVTTHVGHPTLISGLNVLVSCSYGSDIQTQTVSAIVCSLENQSHTWQDLSIKSVLFTDQKDVTVVSAEEMRVLAEAYEIKKSKQDNNVGLALASLVAVGALAALGAPDVATQNVGQVAVIGGAGLTAAREIKQGYSAAQYGPAVYSKDHLLNGGLRIPPDMNILRQIVINHPTIKPTAMEICWNAPVDTCSPISLR